MRVQPATGSECVSYTASLPVGHRCCQCQLRRHHDVVLPNVVSRHAGRRHDAYAHTHSALTRGATCQRWWMGTTVTLSQRRRPHGGFFARPAPAHQAGPSSSPGWQRSEGVTAAVPPLADTAPTPRAAPVPSLAAPSHTCRIAPRHRRVTRQTRATQLEAAPRCRCRHAWPRA